MISHIRFLAMSPEEFASAPVCSGILSESECLSVFMNFNSRENWPMPLRLSTIKQMRRCAGYRAYNYYGNNNPRNGNWP